MTRTLAALAALLALSPALATAAPYAVVALDLKGALLLDMDSVQPGYPVTYRALYVFTEPFRDEGKTVGQVLESREADCARKLIRTVSAEIQGEAGESHGAFAVAKAGEWIDAPPPSEMPGELQMVCMRQLHETQVVPSVAATRVALRKMAAAGRLK